MVIVMTMVTINVASKHFLERDRRKNVMVVWRN